MQRTGLLLFGVTALKRSGIPGPDTLALTAMPPRVKEVLATLTSGQVTEVEDAA